MFSASLDGDKKHTGDRGDGGGDGGGVRLMVSFRIPRAFSAKISSQVPFR